MQNSTLKTQNTENTTITTESQVGLFQARNVFLCTPAVDEGHALPKVNNWKVNWGAPSILE